jgi:cell division septal protein FtsQ
VRTIEAYSKQKVQYIDLRNPRDIYVQLDDVSVRFGEFNDTIFKRAQWIATILPEVRRFPQRVKYIDLRWEDAHYIKLGEETENKKPKAAEITRQRMVPVEEEETQAPVEVEEIQEDVSE